MTCDMGRKRLKKTLKLCKTNKAMGLWPICAAVMSVARPVPSSHELRGGRGERRRGGQGTVPAGRFPHTEGRGLRAMTTGAGADPLASERFTGALYHRQWLAGKLHPLAQEVAVMNNT